jgi:hypothetical protein
MENMSFDDLSLLLGVIETRMILYILVHGLRFPIFQCLHLLCEHSHTLVLCLLEM